MSGPRAFFALAVVMYGVQFRVLILRAASYYQPAVCVHMPAPMPSLERHIVC